MGLVDKYIEALEALGDGRYHYYDGRVNGIGCSQYTRLALINAGIIRNAETFHAASGSPGVLADATRFQKIPWNAANLQRGDILWSNGHHVATWDGNNGVYEAAPESTHGICDNGKTGVGHWSSHTCYNCGTGTKSWSWIYRIIDTEQEEEAAKENIKMDKEAHIRTLIKFLPEIKKGSKCNTVKALQSILQKYGWYKDEIDGIAGPNTVRGIELLQIALGVDTNGVVDQACWEKLLLG